MFEDLTNKVRAYQANQAQTIIGAGIIGIAILVIVLVYSQVEQSLPTPTNAQLAGASTNVTSTFAASMELAPVILIVLVVLPNVAPISSPVSDISPARAPLILIKSVFDLSSRSASGVVSSNCHSCPTLNV